jgi:hypothetical protein
MHSCRNDIIGGFLHCTCAFRCSVPAQAGATVGAARVEMWHRSRMAWHGMAWQSMLPMMRMSV